MERNSTMNGTDHLEDLDVDGETTLQLSQKKHVMRMLNGIK